MIKNVVGRVSVFLFLLTLCFALVGCGQAVEKTVEWEKARLAGRDLRAVTDAQIEEYFSSPPQGCAINAARRDTE